ncbi:heme oxygenase (biliverdin-producing) [Nocardioides houyundeii]|uniref:biliverdin-producing heme oxygenase n=1 Tax=Nocardioides houyundeii TaxID=2045452 RepID=UPI000DF1B4C4|nr:biliverdin-producing heme oxygenase [Nocardioides houyundeii]
MTVLDNAPAAPLSVALREGSQAQHSAAESSTFISDLMGGRINEAGYVNYLRSLRAVYAALEETGRALAADPLVSRLHDPVLDRLGAIDADLAAWSTGAEAEQACEGRAAVEYAERIRWTLDHPVRYVAHHYTRYLGDLSGGQAIGRILDRDFARDGHGLALYRFESIPKIKTYKDVYRARLDGLDLAPAQQAEAVAEVQQAFSHNQSVFAELARHADHFAR